MEKYGAKTYKDPVLNKLIQEKSVWNKQVSALINDLIHFKKSMNGWPSKYYKERTRITQPVPIDLSSILNQIAGEFQDITNQGNGLLQEQATFSKSHVKKKTEQTENATPTEAPSASTAPSTSDLTQQLSKGLTAMEGQLELIKIAGELEEKYSLESLGSNPFTRFVTRLFNPKFGFGEGARVRRLRMTMLDNCVKSFKALKSLHREIVKSSSTSIVSSHKMMTSVWNYWNIVYRLYSATKIIRPDQVKDPGGVIEDPELKKEKELEEGRESEEQPTPPVTMEKAEDAARMIKDYRENVLSLGNDPEITRRLQRLSSVVEKVMAMPDDKKVKALQSPMIGKAYQNAIELVNAEWGTTGSSFQEIADQRKTDIANRVSEQSKTAQRQLGKFRHQILPGATSGSRLEIYKVIDQVRRDLNLVMDLLEQGFDQSKLTPAINQVHRDMTALRTMLRSLYYSEKPEEASSPFF